MGGMDLMITKKESLVGRQNRSRTREHIQKKRTREGIKWSNERSRCSPPFPHFVHSFKIPIHSKILLLLLLINNPYPWTSYSTSLLSQSPKGHRTKPFSLPQPPPLFKSSLPLYYYYCYLLDWCTWSSIIMPLFPMWSNVQLVLHLVGQLVLLSFLLLPTTIQHFYVTFNIHTCTYHVVDFLTCIVK